MKNEHIGLILLSLFLLSLTIMGTTATTNTNNGDKTLTLILQGGAIAEIQFENNTTIPVYNSTTVNFNGSIKLFIHVPHPGLVLLVNGTKYYSGDYNTTINKSIIIYADAIQIYDEIRVNIIGNGNIKMLLYGINNNYSSININKSTSFKINNETFISLSSDSSFIVNNDNLTTKYFAVVALKNITLNIDFNTENISLSNLAKINLSFLGKGVIEVFIDNISAYETLAYHEYNNTATFYAPLGTTIYLLSPIEFNVNGQTANLSETRAYVYMFNVTRNENVLNISFISANITNTYTNSTATITKTSISIENQTITILPKNNNGIYLEMVIVVLIAIILFLLTFIILKGKKGGAIPPSSS